MSPSAFVELLQEQPNWRSALLASAKWYKDYTEQELLWIECQLRCY